MPYALQTDHFTAERSLRPLFQHVMLWSAIIACGVHLVVMIIFWSVGVYGLAWIEAASVIFFSLSFISLYARYHISLWLYLMLAEVLAHGIIASCWVGIDSGFYYYMFIIGPCLVLTEIRPPLFKWSLVVGSIGLILITMFWIRRQGPAVVLAHDVMMGLNVFNLACSMAIMTFVALLYYRLVVQAQQKLGRMASTDPLTGLLNRRSLIDNWTSARATRSVPAGFAVLLCDVDHFKDINDAHGHEIGDRILSTIGKRLREGVRNTDYVARWGGEEFLILLPDASLEAAMQIAEGLRAATGEHPIAAAQKSLRVTLTFGIAHDDTSDSVDQAISRADAALYRGKNGGRNCVRY